jgi:putative membrane protein insertion efficiency factor
MQFLWATLVHLPQWTIVLMVTIYQWTLGPLIGRHCRFQPTCSNYMIQSVQKYGALRGARKGIWRICRCHPWNPGGYDPP